MYPLAVDMWAALKPVGRATNISATITPPSIQHYDYWPDLSLTFGTQMRLFETTAHPWWLSSDQSEDIGGPFTDGFSSGFRGNA